MKFTPLHWAGLLLGAAGAGVAISKFEQAKKAAPATAKAAPGAAAAAKAIANAPKAATTPAAAVANAPPATVTSQQVAVSGVPVTPQMSAMFAAAGFNQQDSKGP